MSGAPAADGLIAALRQDLVATGLGAVQPSLAIKGYDYYGELRYVVGDEHGAIGDSGEVEVVLRDADDPELLSQAAESLQDTLLAGHHIQWPVCRQHRDALLHAETVSDRVWWMCPGAGDPHVTAPVGDLATVSYVRYC